MAKKFCYSTPQTGNCPKCGTSFRNVAYYSAIQGDTTARRASVDQLRVGEKSRTAYTTQYSDIRTHNGSMCFGCAGRKAIWIFGIILLIIAAASGVVYFAMMSEDRNDSYNLIPLAITVVSGIAGYNIVKRFIPLFRGDFSNEDHVSNYFVEHFPKKDISKDRVILSTGFVKNLK
ncbi:MAG: hypothetical protein FWG72_00145 [Oscillospiraceae bacterium]|nr:hypothetical protein [Oscillospiraceae bacterium]